MNKTKIGWAKNPDGSQGYTWNPITGCLNHVNGMCKGGGFPCYAYRLANTRLRERYLANKNWDTRTPEGYEDYPNLGPFYPRLWEDRLDIHKLNMTRPAGIFVCDMSDLFGIGIPEEWTQRILDLIRNCARYHRFYLLTKQPQNLIKWSPFPDNCWVGVTATDAVSACSAGFWMIKDSLEIKAKIRYLSLEPLLGSINGSDHYGMSKGLYLQQILGGFDWVIIGAQTKPYKPPKIEWVREIVEACDKAGIPVFLKDNLFQELFVTAFDNELFWSISSDNPEKAELRQEMPILT